MLPILMFAAALSAAVLPTDGKYLLIGEDDAGIGVLDDATVVRDGDRVQVRVIVAMANHRAPGAPRIEQFIQEWDCRRNRKRFVDSWYFNDDFTPSARDAEDAGWTTSHPDAPFGKVKLHVCDGAALPEAGVNLMTIIQTYWVKVAAGATNAV